MAIFEGAGVALVTPMNENLEVNYDKLEELLEEQIAGGTDAIVICGTTGESATLTEEEHMRTIRFAIDKVNHRIPVLQVPAPIPPQPQHRCPKRQQKQEQMVFFW